MPLTSQKPIFEIRHYFNNIFTGTAGYVTRYGSNVCNWPGGGGLLWNTNYNTTGQILIRVAFYGPSPNFDVIFGNVVISGNLALPVKLSSLLVLEEFNQNIITFTTSSESNSSGFEIQRSSDGTDFDSIGWVDGAGNSSEEKHYQFIDDKPLPGINYYRLKQVDLDGKYEYSDVVSVSFNPSEVSFVTNYTNDEIQIIGADSQTMYYIYSTEGRLIKNGLTQENLINISHLLPGIYLITANVGGKKVNHKIVKWRN